MRNHNKQSKCATDNSKMQSLFSDLLNFVVNVQMIFIADIRLKLKLPISGMTPKAVESILELND